MMLATPVECHFTCWELALGGGAYPRMEANMRREAGNQGSQTSFQYGIVITIAVIC